MKKKTAKKLYVNKSTLVNLGHYKGGAAIVIGTISNCVSKVRTKCDTCEETTCVSNPTVSCAPECPTNKRTCGCPPGEL